MKDEFGLKEDSSFYLPELCLIESVELKTEPDTGSPTFATSAEKLSLLPSEARLPQWSEFGSSEMCRQEEIYHENAENQA